MATKNQLRIELTCNGNVLAMGLGEDIDIISVTGLESSELTVTTSDNALIDGATVDGKKIAPRPIHIEARFRSNANNKENRAQIIKFFNPKYTGKMLITSMGVPRNIEYELEGWTFDERINWDQNLKIIVDLICPDPYMLNVDNFGENMAQITPLFAFPWYVSATNQVNTYDSYDADNDYYLRGAALQGHTMGYRTLLKQAVIPNDGDVPTGVIIKFRATRGPVTNPKITLLSTGQFVQVMTTMAQGDELVVDTNERHQTIELNGVNLYHKINRQSDPFLLEVGDNYMEYDADANYTNLDVNLYYTPKYLGI